MTLCAWQRWAWLAPCGLCCAGALGICTQPTVGAREWLALKLLVLPPLHLQERAPHILRPVVDARMPNDACHYH